MKLSAKMEHPGQHEIDDWFLYGSQNQSVESLVRELTIGHGLRLAEVEGLTTDALMETTLCKT